MAAAAALLLHICSLSSFIPCPLVPLSLCFGSLLAHTQAMFLLLLVRGRLSSLAMMGIHFVPRGSFPLLLPSFQPVVPPPPTGHTKGERREKERGEREGESSNLLLPISATIFVTVTILQPPTQDCCCCFCPELPLLTLSVLAAFFTMDHWSNNQPVALPPSFPLLFATDIKMALPDIIVNFMKKGRERERRTRIFPRARKAKKGRRKGGEREERAECCCLGRAVWYCPSLLAAAAAAWGTWLLLLPVCYLSLFVTSYKSYKLRLRLLNLFILGAY